MPEGSKLFSEEDDNESKELEIKLTEIEISVIGSQEYIKRSIE